MNLAPPPPRPMRLLLPHLVWEAALLLLVLAVVGIAAARTPLLQGPGPWWMVAVVGLMATGLALSIRTGMPNLAVAGIASLTGVGYAWLINEVELPLVLAGLIVLVLAVMFGLLLGLVAGLLSAPAWAVSLGGLVLTQAIMLGLVESFAPVRADPLLGAVGWWLALFLLVSLGGAACWTIPAVRIWLGPDRTADPVRFESSRLIRALLGLGGSSLLAGLSGLAYVAQVRVASPDVSSFLLFLALAAVLIGGVSVFGGRGGIAGTVLGTMLVAVIVHWLLIEGLDQWVRQGLLAVLILAGLGVSRALEALAPIDPMPRLAPPPAAPPPAGPPPAPGYPPPAPGYPPPAGPLQGTAPPGDQPPGYAAPTAPVEDERS